MHRHTLLVPLPSLLLPLFPPSPSPIPSPKLLFSRFNSVDSRLDPDSYNEQGECESSEPTYFGLSMTPATIVAAMVGAAVGVTMSVLGAGSSLVVLVGYPGELFLNGLKMAVVPFGRFQRERETLGRRRGDKRKGRGLNMESI